MPIGHGSCTATLRLPRRPPLPSRLWRRKHLHDSCARAFIAASLLGLAVSLSPLQLLAQETGDPSLLGWLPDLSSAYDEALAQRRPILLRFGAEACPWCQKLQTELAQPAVQKELAGWIRVYLDVDRSPNETRRFGVAKTPSLRILGPNGRWSQSSEGYLTADELIQWLQKVREELAETPDPVLLDQDEPGVLEVLRLIRQFGAQDAILREAALLRLRPYPRLAASGVVRALREGNLASKLTAYDLLGEWQAPLEQIDPWQIATLTDDRLAALDHWLKQQLVEQTPAGDSPATLSPEALQQVQQDLDRLLSAEPVEGPAIRERLARSGALLLPHVLARLDQVADDPSRERLLALRYRLVSGPTLPLRWPGGLERLAATDPSVRHRAAEELAALATDDVQPLLLELFSDPDPLVREVSLQGLRSLGGDKASTALLQLLDDPDPNVRAAVLKQLAEDAPSEMLDAVGDYVGREPDADLVVHAIRFFRQVQDARGLPKLLPLLKHGSWQVRAEAAEAVGQSLEGLTSDGDERSDLDPADVYDALLELLDDGDAFVVSRALEALQDINVPRAVEPLVRAAGKHPDLAAHVAQILADGSEMRELALPHLRTFFRSEDPAIRAGAIRGLCVARSDQLTDELQVARSAIRMLASAPWQPRHCWTCSIRSTLPIGRSETTPLRCLRAAGSAD